MKLVQALVIASSLSLASISASVAAQPAGAPSDAASPRSFAGGPGQQAIVYARQKGELVVKVCKDPARCDLSDGTVLRPPAAARAKPTQVDSIVLEGGKVVVRVSFLTGEGETFDALLASDGAELKLLFKGRSVEGKSGLGVTKKGASSRVEETVRVDLCGRETALRRRALDPKKLTWTDQSIPDPLGAQRASSQSIAASPIEATKARHALLSVRGASSGEASRALDGDPDSAWSDASEPEVAHSVLVFDAPAEVPLTGFELAFAKEGRAPEALTIVTDDKSFAVTPSVGAGRVAIELPAPVRTRCVALVFDKAARKDAKGDRKSKPDSKEKPARVALGELALRTSFDGESLIEVAKGLADKESGKARGALLDAAGEAGRAALREAYASLDASARERVRRTVDAGDCGERAAFYTARLADKEREESDRARSELRRCPEQAAETLIAELDKASLPEVRAIYAEEAGFVAPALTVPKLIDRLAKAGSSEERRPYRRGLAKAATRATGVKALDAALGAEGFAARDLATRVDVLRALGENAAGVKGAPVALDAALRDAKEFRERFLLLAPAGEIARGGSEVAAASLKAALGDEDPRLRARAAASAWGIPALQSELTAALSDPKVRVREAALDALTRGEAGSKVGAELAKQLVARLTEDPWTFVRLGAASALAAAAPSAEVDAKVAASVEIEESPRVRAELMRTLGARKALLQAATVRSRALDAKEVVEVRSEAISALGKMCDRESTDALTQLALAGRVPLFEIDRKLSAVAVGALDRLHPADLAQRLAPLLDKGAVPDIRDVAKKAVSGQGTDRCGGSASAAAK